MTNISVYDKDQEPRGQLEGELKEWLDADGKVIAWVLLDDGRYCSVEFDKAQILAKIKANKEDARVKAARESAKRSEEDG